MKRKVTCIVIIASMFLHCSCRLGLLSYLYENRNEIALKIGLIKEVSIALCSSDFHFNAELILKSNSVDDQIPVNFLHTQEINLFYVSTMPILFVHQIPLANKLPIADVDNFYGRPILSIFHPPTVVG